MQRGKRKRKLRYTVMMVPNNAQSVRQFRVSLDFLLAISLILFVVLFAGVVYITYSAAALDQAREKVEQVNQDMKELSDTNILLQADLEEITGQLRDVTVTLDAKETAEQTAQEEESLKYIPSGFPLDGTASLPSEFSEQAQYVTFEAGFGTKIVATGDGTVTYVGEDAVFGHIVKIDHGNGYVSIYCDTSDVTVNEGDKVIRGTTLFIMNSDLEKLTYQISYEDKLIDPMTVMEING